MSLEKFVSENPCLSGEWGLDAALEELRKLRRMKVRFLKREKLVEVLRTLLDGRASIEEFKAAVKEVIG